MNTENQTSKETEIKEPINMMSALRAEHTIRKLFTRVEQDVFGQIKNLFAQYSQEASKSIVDQTNAAIEKLDKKFSGLYGALVNKFLLKLETRVYGGEIAIQSMIEEVAERLFELDSAIKSVEYKASEDAATALAAFTKAFDEAIVKRGDGIQKRWADAREAAAKAEQEKLAAKAEEKNDGQNQGSDVSSDSSQQTN